LNRSLSRSKTRAARSHSPSVSKEQVESVPQTKNGDDAAKTENAEKTGTF
jgi:hypothetical protein